MLVKKFENYQPFFAFRPISAANVSGKPIVDISTKYLLIICTSLLLYSILYTYAYGTGTFCVRYPSIRQFKKIMFVERLIDRLRYR